MTKLFQSTYQTIEFPDSRQDLSRYERDVTYVFSKKDWETLVEELPDEWQGETICGFLCIHFGDEEELYAKARMRFGLRYKRVITLRLLDWLMLAQSWALSSNEKVRELAAWIAKREFFSLSCELFLITQDFLGMLTEEEENEIRSMIFKDFDVSSSHYTPGLRARYKSFRRKEEKKDGE